MRKLSLRPLLIHSTMIKGSFHQDRLGTSIGKTQKKKSFARRSAFSARENPHVNRNAAFFDGPINHLRGQEVRENASFCAILY